MHFGKQAKPLGRFTRNVGQYVCLLVFLSGCGLNPVKTEVVTVTPPETLMQRCPVPEYKGTTIGYHIEEYTPELIGAVRECDAQMEALIEWREGVE